MVLPSIARRTIGVVAVGARRYIDLFGALYRSVFILYFPSVEVADATFTLFDRNGNGDAPLEETEQSCAFVMLPIPCLIRDLPPALETFLGSS